MIGNRSPTPNFRRAPKAGTEDGITRAIVDLMRRATKANPVTKADIAQKLARQFGRSEDAIKHSVQFVKWYSGGPTAQANPTLDRLLKGSKVRVVHSRPLGLYISSAIRKYAGTGMPPYRKPPSNREEAVEKEQRKHVTYEIVQRSRMVAALVKAKRGYRCEICNLRFEDRYGELGTGFLEAHHLVPVARKEQPKWDATPESLAGLCSNCHRMLHRLLGRERVDTVAQGRDRVRELRRIVQLHAG